MHLLRSGSPTPRPACSALAGLFPFPFPGVPKASLRLQARALQPRPERRQENRQRNRWEAKNSARLDRLYEGADD